MDIRRSRGSAPRDTRNRAPSPASKARSHTNRGDDRLEDCSWEAAIRAYNGALRHNPGQASALSGRAVAHWHLGQRDDALNDLHAALTHDPNDARGLIWRGHAGLVMGSDLSMALGRLQTAHSLRPQDVDVTARLALTHIKRGDDGSALLLLDDMIAGDAFHEQALLLRADVHARAGDTARALRDVDALLTHRPTHPGALSRRGNLLLALGRNRDATRAYAGAVRGRPEIGRDLYNTPAYRRMLDEALANDSSDEVAANLRGDILRFKRYWDNAITNYDITLRHNPANADALAGRADSYLDRRDPGYRSLAKEGFRAALDIDCNHPLALVTKGDYLRTGDHYRTAVKTYKRAIACSGDTQALLNRAIVGKSQAETQLGRYHDARKTLRALPEDAIALACQQRGFVYLKQGAYRRSVDAFTLALQHDSDDAYAMAGRGEAYRKQHKFRLALDDYATALRTNPFFTDAYDLAMLGEQKARKSYRLRPYLRFFRDR